MYARSSLSQVFSYFKYLSLLGNFSFGNDFGIVGEAQSQSEVSNNGVFGVI